MEENSEKNTSNESEFEDFKDFDDGEMTRPELEAEEIGEPVFQESSQGEHESDLLKEAELIAKLTQEAGFGTPEYLKGNTGDNINPDEEIGEENSLESNEPLEDENQNNEDDNKEVQLNPIDEQTEIKQPEPSSEPNQWEELDEENAVVKKYIFYVSKDFIPLIDSMTPDERTGYINDAIQRKVDSESEYNEIDRKKRILAHIITMILTFLIVTPVMLFLVYKSIMITFDNYKYSQDSFEKLYKERFSKDPAYRRALEHNMRYEKAVKKEK